MFVIQHGDKERLPGDPGLTPLGKKQARSTGKWLGRFAAPVAIWSSPMRRALDTAEVLADELGLDVTVERRLHERMNWAGPEPFEDFLRAWGRCSADRALVPSSGDSSIDAGARFLDALGELAARHRAGTAVVVSHGGVTTDALRTLLGDDQLLVHAPTLIDEGVPSCAITTLQQKESTWTVESVAATVHLAE